MTEPPASAASGAMAATYRSLTAGLLAIITFSAFEAMAVATAMPAVARELDGQSGYGLAFSMFLTASLLGSVLGGLWCDARGPRPAVGTGLGLTVAGLVLSGLAGEFWIFTAGRAVAGLGGGFMIVAVYVIIGQAYPQKLQPVVFGWIAAAWVVPSLVGPLAAGLVTQYVSWRLVFYGVAPLVLASVLAVWPRIRRLGAPQAAESGPRRRGGRRRALRGLVLAAGVFLAQWAGFEAVDAAAGRAAGLYLLAAAGVVLAVCVLPGLMPAGLLRLRRGLPSVVLTRGALNVAFFGAEAFVPLMLVVSRGLDPATAGLALTAGALGWSIGSFIQAKAGRRRHLLLVLGPGLLGACLGAMALAAGPQVPFWVLVVVWGLAGLSMGMALSTTSVLVLELSAPAERGRNSSSLQLADQLGGVVGTAGAGGLFTLLHRPGNPADSGVFAAIWLVLAACAAAGLYTGWRSSTRRATAATKEEIRSV
ncbi:MFS transporter [Arthrobacter mobilis]|uniref:MFS transporter n=1 Tax=Arthrobacter mobilis TaxID=2724944 RepID=A0A7X6HCG6_9MICC|nr:MFS transporter [Arthrobacter mobilis]NKX54583.1 MFS transporter [Arthrobacter mobilis]